MFFFKWWIIFHFFPGDHQQVTARWLTENVFTIMDSQITKLKIPSKGVNFLTFIDKSLSAQLVSSIIESTVKDMSESNHHFWSFLSEFLCTLIYTLIPLPQIKISLHILFFIISFVYLFMLGLHHWAGFSLVAASRGLLSRCSLWVPHRAGESCCGARAQKSWHLA